VRQADDPAGTVAPVAGDRAVGVGQCGAQPVGVVRPADGAVAHAPFDEPPGRVPPQLNRFSSALRASESGVGQV
jgi:hypothetical protein